jgi:hypothetical protein
MWAAATNHAQGALVFHVTFSGVGAKARPLAEQKQAS